MKSKLQLEILPDSLRPAADSQALVKFANCQPGEKIIELGSGMGNVTLELAENCAGYFTGLELQQPLFETAQKNLRTNEHLLQGTVKFKLTDLRNIDNALKATYDRVIMNPPWYAKGAGRLSPKPLRAAAKHELNGTLEDFLIAANFLLKESGVCVLICLSERLEEMKKSCQKINLHLNSLRNVVSHPNLPPLWFIAEISKKSDCKFSELEKFILPQPESN